MVNSPGKSTCYSLAAFGRSYLSVYFEIHKIYLNHLDGFLPNAFYYRQTHR
jgi:hypothetical protein